MVQQEENLRNALIASTTMHVAMFLLLYFGVPSFMKIAPIPAPWRPVPIDIVEIGAITNTRIRGDNEETAKTAPPAKPVPAPEVKAPEPPKPPEAKPAEAKAEPVPDDATLPKPQTQPKPPEPAKEAAKDQGKQQPAPDPLASVLKNVAKLKPSAVPATDARPSDKKSDGTSMTGNSTGVGPALGDRLTISQEDAIRRQIGACWNMPIGAKDAQNLIVEVVIEVNEDRTVRSAQVVDQARYNTDTHFRAAADAALRALHHPKCTPLALPPEEYEHWKIIHFNFDPRDML